MADSILDNVTINQPVANAAALAMLPTGSLATGCMVQVIADTNTQPSTYEWNGSAWVLLLPNIDAGTSKGSPVLADEIQIADSAAAFAAKKATLTALQTALVTTAKVNAAFAPGSLATKATPVAADLVVIGDSAVTNTPKTSTLAQIAAAGTASLAVDSLTAKGSLVGLDEFLIADSAASFVAKKITLSTLQAALAPTGAQDVITTRITLNVASGTPVVAYTVPVGFTFKAQSILVEGSVALVGPGTTVSVGTTAGSNIDILAATTITPTLVAGQAMAPIAPNAVNAVVAAGTVINAVVVLTEVSGAVLLQLDGVLNPV